MNKRPEEAPGKFPAFLDSGITIEGQIKFTNTLRVAGTLRGEIHGGNELIVDPSGLVEGKVRVRHLYVRGKVHGDEIQVDRLEIFPEGRVEGQVKTRALVVHEGGVLQARCEMELKPKATVSMVK